jgi:hypothetical protein
MEESDHAIVPMKPPNKEAHASAEAAEGRARTKENDAQSDTHPTQSGKRVSQGLLLGRLPSTVGDRCTASRRDLRPSAVLQPLTGLRVP